MRTAAKARAIKATEQVRGARPSGVSDAKYLGGHPPGWPYSGCNPSRFRPYPRWPPPEDVAAAIRNSTEHSVGSDLFIYHGHGPSAAELAPKLRAFVGALEAGQGFVSVEATKPQRFVGLLQRTLAPWALRTTAHIFPAVRKGGARAWRDRSVHGVPRLLADLVQARLSLEAFAKATAERTAGLQAEHASRDDSYYWRWTRRRLRRR